MTEVAPEHAELMKGDPLRGVHAFYAASAREWWAPLRPDHRVFRRNALVGVLDKPSEFADRAIHEWTAQVFRDDEGALLAGAVPADDPHRAGEGARAQEVRRCGHRALRPTSTSPRSTRSTQRERPRGSEPRWWDDVEEGDEVGPLVKGPLTVTDMICWHVGMGMGLYGVKPLRLGWRNRQRIPRFFHRDDLGRARRDAAGALGPRLRPPAGNPTTFDYGRMRETWLIHLCTDWMGDDAWLWKLDCEFRLFNYVGDTHWMRGRVDAQVPRRRRRPAVDLDVWGENQRGEVTCPGHATVLLPSREHGPVRSARRRRAAPPTCKGALDAIAASGSRRACTSERDGGVLRLRLDSPARRNALDDASIAALIDAARGRRSGRRGAGRSSLSGAGDDFCSGFDIVGRNQAAGRTSPRRQHPAPAPGAGAPAHPAAARGAGAGRVRGAGLGGRASASSSRSPPTSRVAARDARFWEPFMRAGLHARQRRHLAAAAAGRAWPGRASCSSSAASSAGRRPRSGA